MELFSFEVAESILEDFHCIFLVHTICMIQFFIEVPNIHQNKYFKHPLKYKVRKVNNFLFLLLPQKNMNFQGKANILCFHYQSRSCFNIMSICWTLANYGLHCMEYILMQPYYAKLR